eukprot:jgi/Tetstr1/458138/TSEL_044630.t1
MEFATTARVALSDCAADSGGRGLLCTADAPQGSVLLEVPLSACWTVEAARSHPDLAGLAAETLPARDLLALHLMLEAAAGARSPRAAHVASLPSVQEIGLPLVWAEAELLEGSEVHIECTKLREELPEDFAAMAAALDAAGLQHLLKSRGLGYADYLWARCIYWSRYMEFTEADGSHTMALCPGVDMFNHSPAAPAGLFKLDRAAGTVAVTAGAEYKEGQQAFINYKPNSWNDQLLLSFGFALPGGQLAASVITFSLQVSAAQLAAHTTLLAAEDAAATAAARPAQHTVLHTPGPEALVAGGGTAELIMRHRLLPASPLPTALLGMARIQHCTPGALAVQPEGGGPLGVHPLAPAVELRVLGFLHRLLSGKLDGFRSPPAADREALANDASIPPRRRYAALLRAGERQALTAALEAASAACAAALRDVLGSVVRAEGRCGCRMCGMAGTPWFHPLQAAAPALDAAEAALPGLCDALAAAAPLGALVQAAGLIHLWAADALPGEGDAAGLAAARTCPAAWPMEAEAEGRVTEVEAVAALDWAALQRQAGARHNPGLTEHLASVARWGGRLAAQWALTGALRLADLAAARREWAALAEAHALNLPTSAALGLMARHGPLLEVGAGSGYWASLLAKMRVDIVAVSSPTWEGRWNGQGGREEGEPLAAAGGTAPAFAGVAAGGPETVAAHPARTLVLMWPDYGGAGGYGLAAVEAYTGEALLLVGEWADCRPPGGPPHGAAFSPELQALVEERFERADTLPLPNWPGRAGRLMLFKRRSGTA